MTLYYHAVAQDKNHLEADADRIAASIYAKDEHTDADYDTLILVRRDLPQERQVKTEVNPAVKTALLAEARSIRAASQARKLAKQQDAAQEEFDRRNAATAPAPYVAPDHALRDELFAVLHEDNASEKAKLEARAKLWANKLEWPEQLLLLKVDPYTAGELQNTIHRYRRELEELSRAPTSEVAAA